MAETDPSHMLTGRRRMLAAIALASANLMVMFDMTIANVSVPHIAGSLGISASQGIWVITSYAVAEAICVPLTGWLAERFGAVRCFVLGALGFGLFSILCGMSLTLGMLVACRIGQGLCGGPIMPLTQTLMMRLFPPEKRSQAMGIWAITTIIGPVLGPVIGGTISDNFSWHWIFFINVPIVLFCAITAHTMLRPIETPTAKRPIDRVGLALLVTWISALQIMLDIGREHDWFADPTVLALGLTAVIVFAIFVVWELTEEHPIVDLRIFRHRSFTVGVLTLAIGFGCYFAGTVIIPQWMQLSMGYTATQAGIATAASGMAGLFVARFPPLLLKHVDPRIMLSGALIWVGCATLLRVTWTSGADFATLITPQFVMGLGMPFFFITATSVSLGSIPPNEMASAAGLQNFVRTIALAASTSIVMTYWGDQSRVANSELAGKLNGDATTSTLIASGLSPEQARAMIAQLVDREAVTLATDKVFLIAGLAMIAIAAWVWTSPRPKTTLQPGAGGH
ncbi:multidrug resistance protein B [Sphingomonas sp. Root710]|uniref:DHA2 family efflux MFS transporter permease subunit n=1 Tax=Sphingomonas sp. Root710 TaxID=1736594 RepID=UPI0006FBDF3D|nr:DHA2 family efflux MFS transporter permease subunit [Sphingomonas sp. Root710]KRB86447.1 multidrug resistance protein B [Sphingomonas sp. Root710]